MRLISNIEMEREGLMPVNKIVFLDDIKGIMTIERKSPITGRGSRFNVFYPPSHYQCASDGMSTGSASLDHLALNL